MKRYLLISICFLLLYSCRKDVAVAPVPEKEYAIHHSWTFGGPLGDAARSIGYANGKIFLVGSTASFGNGMIDLYMLVLDTSVSITNEKTLGGASDDVGISITNTTNGMAISGYTDSYGNRQAWLISTDFNGDTLWTNHYNITGSSVAFNVASDATGYFLAGNALDASGNNDMLLIRTDLNGNLLWYRTYGGVSNDAATDIEILSTGDLLIYGFTYSFGNGDRDLWLLKTNANGDSLTSRFYAGSGYEQPGNMRKISGGKLLLSAHTASTEPNHNFYYALIDENLNLIWSGESGSGEHDGAEDIIESENGFLCIGHSFGNGAGNSDVMITELKPDGSYKRSFYYGFQADEYVYSIVKAGSCYFMAGSAAVNANPDFFLVKLE